MIFELVIHETIFLFTDDAVSMDEMQTNQCFGVSVWQKEACSNAINQIRVKLL